MKSKINLLLALFLISVCGSLPAQSLWSQSAQPAGGTCFTIHRVGSEIWAGYFYGVYVSVNDGITWHKHPFINQPVMDIEAKGDTVVVLIQQNPSVANNNMATITSYNNGVTFGAPVIVENDYTSYYYGRHEIWMLDSAWVIYNNGAQYYVSKDYAQSWDSLLFPGYFIISAHTNKYMLASSASNPFGNFYSDDGGDTWTFLDSAHVSGTALIVDSTFYFMDYHTDTTNHYFIARTSNFGASYDTIAYDLQPTYNNLTSFNGKIYLQSFPYPLGPFIYESSDGGDNWTLSSLHPDMGWTNDDEAILTSNWEFLVAMYGKGITRYVPNTNSVYHTETGILANRIDFLEENNGVLFAEVNDKIYRSSTGGLTWNALPDFVVAPLGLSYSGDTIYTATRPYNNQNNFCYSYDNGVTWDTIHTVIQTYWNSVAQVVPYKGKLYASNNNFVAVSNDGGVTWDSVSTLVDTACNGSILYASQLIVQNDQLFLLNEYTHSVLKLDTVSQTWQKKLCYNSPGVSFQHLFSLENALVLVGNGVFKLSVDTGKTWTIPQRNGIPTGYRPTGLRKINGAWFAQVGPGQVYYSLDLGDNWFQYQTDSGMYVTAGLPIFSFLNGILYAGGNNVWRNNDTLQSISGTVFLDNNNNGIHDSGEPALNDQLLYSTPHNIVFDTDSAGFYQFLTSAVGDTLRPVPPSAFCQSNPTYYLTAGQSATVDFGLYFSPNIQDIAVDMTNRSVFSPGFGTYLDIDVTNLGTVGFNSTLEVILDTSLIYHNSSLNPQSINGDTLIFSIPQLALMEKAEISIHTETHFLTPLTTPVHCIASVFPVVGDTVPQNNISEINEVTMGSFDPNDKQSSFDPFFTPAQVLNGDEMVYTIRFQNTGNLPAINIFIRDTLSDFIDLSSFRLVSMSHQGYFEFTQDRTVTFYFNNINLPASVVDEPNSHGYVKYAVKFFPTLEYGTGVENTAYIFFDFNPPIMTNTVTTLIADPPINVSLPEREKESYVTVFPNPVHEVLQIKVSNGKRDGRYVLMVYNTEGRRLAVQRFEGIHYSLDVGSFSNGIYNGILLSESDNRRLIFRMAVIH